MFVAERQPAEVNEPNRKIDGQMLITACVRSVLFFFFCSLRKKNDDSITNVKQKINEISVSCRLLSVEH
jgi:hypothetical protein